MLCRIVQVGLVDSQTMRISTTSYTGVHTTRSEYFATDADDAGFILRVLEVQCGSKKRAKLVLPWVKKLEVLVQQGGDLV